MSENLLFEESQVPAKKVVCLGMEFEDEDARRAYFTELLRVKLLDTEFRKIEGFPIGEDADILALSDPPYYTACPNPWIADFVAEWEGQKPPKPKGYSYHREPYALDVEETKSAGIYNAHSYHTKVPHKAIMRYLLHYTAPGDMVYDGFCGTGMMGVASQLCGDRNEVESLGYMVQADGTILRNELNDDGDSTWVPFSALGERHSILSDLSPMASFLAESHNTPQNIDTFEKLGAKLLASLEAESGWMYTTTHSDGRKGIINYTIWSDVFSCPECLFEMVFWEVAVDKEKGAIRNNFDCPSCSKELSKGKLTRSWVTEIDQTTGEKTTQAKSVPVAINYHLVGSSKNFEKKPDADDILLISNINNLRTEHWHPTEKIVKGDKTPEATRQGITSVHHLFTRRNLLALACAWEFSPASHKWAVTGCMQRASKQHQIAITRIGGEKAGEGGATAGHRRGTLYIPSNQVEMSVILLLRERIRQLRKIYSKLTKRAIISNSSASNAVSIPKNSIDYIFIDPPFGSNIMYSELNQIWESWLRIGTNNIDEAIENKTQKKNLDDYRVIMRRSFQQCYSVLKPGGWITIEFSNTNASVWNSIQSALGDSGFILTNVTGLNKGRGGLNAIVGNVAVRKDLIITAYKPNGGFEERFLNEANSDEGVWDFVKTHLKYLPVVKRQGTVLQVIQERDARILFDQMVAYYVRKGFMVPLSSQGFQLGLSQRFSERDGMYFLPEQALEYDQKKLNSGEVVQASLFVSDEATAIQWLRHYIHEKPQTFAEINPHFMQQLGGWNKNEEMLDLRELLQQNFLCYEGDGPVPDAIFAYLRSNWKESRGLGQDHPLIVSKAHDHWYLPDPNKASDLEKLRERALLKEFDVYRNAKKRLKVFRLEAVRAGFKKAWQERDYYTIINVAELIPHNVLEEDPKLLMWYDQALTRKGGE